VTHGLPSTPLHDRRPTRKVVRYVDTAALAQDELECGHLVICTRRPGGRVVVPHDEPCGECARNASVVADGADSPAGRGSGTTADGTRGMRRG